MSSYLEGEEYTAYYWCELDCIMSLLHNELRRFECHGRLHFHNLK